MSSRLLVMQKVYPCTQKPQDMCASVGSVSKLSVSKVFHKCLKRASASLYSDHSWAPMKEALEIPSITLTPR
jgi:hypothetical protein